MKRYTKPTAPLGWLYVVSHPNAPSQVKIGITERPVTRMQELGNPKILSRVPVMKPRDKEQLLHNRYAPQRVPQTEYFQLDQEQLDSVLRACTSWMLEVQNLIVEPQIPDTDKTCDGFMDHQNSHVDKAEPMEGFPEPDETLREFIERPARERREALDAREKQRAEAERLHQEWLGKQGIKPPETKEEREQRERKEYQAWVKSVENSL